MLHLTINSYLSESRGVGTDLGWKINLDILVYISHWSHKNRGNQLWGIYSGKRKKITASPSLVHRTVHPAYGGYSTVWQKKKKIKHCNFKDLLSANMEI